MPNEANLAIPIRILLKIVDCEISRAPARGLPSKLHTAVNELREIVNHAMLHGTKLKLP